MLKISAIGAMLHLKKSGMQVQAERVRIICSSEFVWRQFFCIAFVAEELLERTQFGEFAAEYVFYCRVYGGRTRV